MLAILITPLLLTALSSVVGSERQFLAPGLVKLKRGVLDVGHHVHQIQSIGPNVPRYRNVKIIPQESTYKDVLKPPPPYASSYPVAAPSSEFQSHEQPSSHAENLFTISAGYKVASDGGNVKPFKQTGVNVQGPVYKTTYPLTKSTDAPLYGTTYQNRKAPLPIYLPQKSQEGAAYSGSLQQGHALVSNPRGHRFDFTARAPKANGNALAGVPFLSPLSSFQGQVVAIPTAANNPQFPQYKGATVEVYPTVGGFSTVAYQPLQAQPQLHFTNVQHVQPVDNPRQPPPRAQEIRSDVEIIDKKKPRPPPKKDDDDDDEEDEEDEGYSSQGKHYGINSDVDSDYRPKPGKYFKSSPAQGDFKPSTSFPFKQYDETFGKYANQNRDEETDAKPYPRYQGYASTSDDKDDEDEPSGRYHSEDSSPKSYYGNKEEENEDEDGDGEEYEKQRTEESSDSGSKYFDKGFDEEFEASYRREVPKHKYSYAKDEYGSGSPRRSKDNYETEGSPGQSNRKRINYRKTSAANYDDAEARNSDILTSLAPTTIPGESFGHRIPQKRY